ncbi:hypothetical protein ACFY12_25740 [Streptomyces sp. NPDC001339]|uniref:hypothetical protein n=1 Tax=Streptomyces sp. NPDC001339 TaxID=3364563 RepID=UPI0036B5A723
MLNNTESEEQVTALVSLFAERLASYGNDVNRARHDLGLRELWAFTSPEIRRHLLLFVSWEARHSKRDDAEALTTADQYAWAFAGIASSWAKQHQDGDAEAFCAGPHAARHAASSLAFDRDDLAVSLETALLLTIRTPMPEQW